MIRNYTELDRFLKDSRINIDPRIAYAAENPRERNSVCYTPSPMLAAIAAAGNIRRTRPQARLVNRPLPEIPSRLGLIKIFRSMLNSTVEPADDLEVPTFSYPGRGRSISVCSSAESKLAITYLALEDGDDEVTHAQVITKNGSPLFIRKGLGHSSAMNIQDVVVNGVPAPAGSLFRVDTVHDQPGDEKDNDNSVRTPDGLTVCDAEDITYVGFRRLSMYALPTVARETYITQLTTDSGLARGVNRIMYDALPIDFADATDSALHPLAHVLHR